MKKILFQLFIYLCLLPTIQAQIITSIKNSYSLNHFISNRVIYLTSVLQKKNGKKLLLSKADEYAKWNKLKLLSSNIPVYRLNDKIEVDFYAVTKEQHTLILRYTDLHEKIFVTDTIQLPYFEEIVLTENEFELDKEYQLKYKLKYSDGTIAEDSWNILNSNEIFSCNDNFIYENNKIKFIYKENYKCNLCLMNKKNQLLFYDNPVKIVLPKQAYLDFSGIDGRHGKDAVNGNIPSESGKNGDNGTDGTDGQNVTVFVRKFKKMNQDAHLVEAFGSKGIYKKIEFSSQGILTINTSGGNGGNGGKGSNGSSGIHNPNNEHQTAYGGNGGNGGSGGNGGNSGSILIYIEENSSDFEKQLVFHNDKGKAGLGGEKGYNGADDSGSLITNLLVKDSGKDGINGLNGVDGQQNEFKKIIGLTAENFDKEYLEKIKQMQYLKNR